LTKIIYINMRFDL